MGYKSAILNGLQAAYLVFIVYQFVLMAQVANHRQKLQKSTGYPQFADFIPAGGIAVFLTCFHYFVKAFCRPIALSVIARKSKWSEEIYQAKISRFGSAVFKLIFFTVFTIQLYVVLRNAEWMPPELGGAGSTGRCWLDGFPYQHVDAHLKWCYIVASGYYVSEVVFQLLFEWDRPDFREMMIHHTTAAFLLLFSYMMNYTRVGSLVFFVFCCSDISSYLVKLTVDTKYKYLTFVVYLSVLASWGYLRLYVLPAHIIYCTWFESMALIPDEENLMGWGFFNTLLLVLLVLNLYWYVLLLRMGYHFLSKGETRDMQANLTAMDLKNQQRKQQ